MKIKTCQTIRIWPNTEIQTQISGVGTSFSPFSLYNKDFVLEVCQKGAGDCQFGIFKGQTDNCTLSWYYNLYILKVAQIQNK